MKKRVLTTILAGVLAVSAFAGCGSSKDVYKRQVRYRGADRVNTGFEK